MFDAEGNGQLSESGSLSSPSWLFRARSEPTRERCRGRLGLEESFFEFLERTRAVDKVLAVLAIVGPIAVAILVKVGRRWAWVGDRRPDWGLWLVAGPLVLALWRVHNAILDAFGVDSLYGLVFDACIFVCVGLAVALARIWLWRYVRPVPRDGTPSEATELKTAQETGKDEHEDEYAH